MSEQTTTVDTSSSAELKAGHAPAIKVGGMRVSAPRPRHTSQGEDKDKASKTEANADDQEASKDQKAEGENAGESTTQEGETSSAVAAHAEGEMVAGTFVPIQKAFPTEAVKHIHEKPGTHPKHEYHAHAKRDEHHMLNQPRK